MNCKFKSVNQKYLKNIFSSRAFFDDFLNILQSSYVIDYYDSKISSKLRKFLIRWEVSKRTINSFEEFRGKVEHYFQKSGTCKIPWTSNEVRNARDYFIRYLKERRTITLDKEA